MRLLELFIIETTEEDRAIISLSGPINDLLQKYADQDIDWDNEDNETLTIGRLGNLFNTPFTGIDNIKLVIQSDYHLLQRAKKENHKSKDAPAGMWDAATRSLIFNADYLSADYMKSIISHELRHMLDDIKSDFRVSTSRGYSTPRDKQYRRPSTDPYTADMQYLAQPAEINARFLQVLDALVPIINRLSSRPRAEARSKLHRYLNGQMQRFDISNMFRNRERSPDYKRLLKRAADFIEKELDYRSKK